MPKSKKAQGSGKNASAGVGQKTLSGHDFTRYPMLKKPLEVIGKQLRVPGSFWDNCPAAQMDLQYKCTIREYSLLHRFTVGPPQAAFQMQEMGERGTGSLELGDSSGEVFWMKYPSPFLSYYYQTFPGELPKDAAEEADDVLDHGTAGNDALTPDVLAVAQTRKNREKSMLYGFVALIGDKLVTAGQYRGYHEWYYTCNIDLGGNPCGSKFTLRAPEGKAPATGNIARHLANFADRCPHHHEANQQFLAASKNTVLDAQGNLMHVFSFEEAFPHHVDFVWLRASGAVSARIARNAGFRDYVRGYERRAAFPHLITMNRIAEAIEELQREERRTRLKKYAASFKGHESIGIQMDMWTDTDTHTSFACINVTTIIEPDVETTDSGTPEHTDGGTTPAGPATRKSHDRHQQLRILSEVLDFNKFPFTEHTGEHIATWFKETLEKEGVKFSSVAGISPDGAADGQCAMASIAELGEKTDTCDLHRLQRAVLAALGLSGRVSKNDEVKSLLRKHGRIVTLSHQSNAVSEGIHDMQVVVTLYHSPSQCRA